jgi:formylglycine-generating enzyme required for sulfatase activity
MSQKLFQSQSFAFESLTLDRNGVVRSRQPGQAQQYTLELEHGIQLELVAVPEGHFQMGAREEGSYPDELPIHPVFLHAFYLGKYPVTQGQWLAIMGMLPDCRFHGADRLIESISWKDASRFCRRLSEKTGYPFTLPSEAQWEYACRAGTRTPFNLGETLTTDYANFVGNYTYAASPPGVYRHETTPPDAFLPNAWGLYDMHGNVWEFCLDAWSDDYSGAAANGAPVQAARKRSEPNFKVCRGGSWHEPPQHCRSATRLRVEENDRMEFYGLRVALNEIP